MSQPFHLKKLRGRVWNIYSLIKFVRAKWNRFRNELEEENKCFLFLLIIYNSNMSVLYAANSLFNQYINSVFCRVWERFIIYQNCFVATFPRPSQCQGPALVPFPSTWGRAVNYRDNWIFTPAWGSLATSQVEEGLCQYILLKSFNTFFYSLRLRGLNVPLVVV